MTCPSALFSCSFHLLHPKKNPQTFVLFLSSPHIPGLLAVLHRGIQLVSAGGQFGRYCKSMFRRTFHSTPSCVFFPPPLLYFLSVPGEQLATTCLPASSKPSRNSRFRVCGRQKGQTVCKPSRRSQHVEPTLWEQLCSRQSSLCFVNRAKRDLEVSFFSCLF